MLRRLFLPALAIGTIVAALATWQTDIRPRLAENRFVRAVEAYEAGDAEGALRHLERVGALPGGGADVAMLAGWAHWRLGRLGEAEAAFHAALEADPQWFEAADALGMARLALDRAEAAIPPLETATRLRPADPPSHLRLGDAYARTGRNRDAAELYERMLEWDPPVPEAERRLLAIFGAPRLEALPEVQGAEVPALSTADNAPRFAFRASGDHLQVRADGRWRTAYLTGVNLGPARPGEWAVSASLEHATYRDWLLEIAAGAANTVRAYTILPPAFYRALADHNLDAPEPLWLIQEVWLDDEARDLYDEETRTDFEREVRRAIDVIHGRGDLPCRAGHYCGIYTADVSAWVIGLALGREVEPSLALRTNAGSPGRTSWDGEYVSLREGHPTEAWFAQMLDLAARYETDTYGAQRPLTVVNWPPLDPIRHPTEGTQQEEILARRALGEQVSEEVTEFPNDMDAVSLEMTRFTAEAPFRAGLFALYHVYQHWPDFLFLEPSFAEARDREGPNRYLGYLRELKRHYAGMPLLIGEYGVSTSPVPVHLHPDGWHNGGLDEREQAALLARFTRNIRDAGMAGGIVFAWLDEWWKQVHDEFTAPFEPRDFDPLWRNALDPEEHFGLVGFRPFDERPQLRGRLADWDRADLLAEAGDGPLRSLRATHDYAWLHLAVELAPEADWDALSLQVALNPLPGEVGSTRLPGAGVELDSGAAFLAEVTGSVPGRLRVAESYLPWHAVQPPGRDDLLRIQPRRGLAPTFGPQGFADMVIEANRPRYGRDGTEFPPRTFDRSVLPHGTGDRDDPAFDDHAMWRADPEAGLVELRIPWGLLLVLDPTRRLVFAGTDEEGAPRSATAPGMAVSVVALSRAREGGPPVATLPASSAGGFEAGPIGSVLYAWDGWEAPRWRAYHKPAYGALRAIWSSWPRFLD